jgi:uroporphyrinogen-III synthase
LNVPGSSHLKPAPLPLAGRRIVITRPEPDARHLADRLQALGAVPIVIPTIRIEFADPKPLDDALANIRSYDWIIFTSRHGVEAVFRRTKAIKGPRVAAIGPATAAELERHGVLPDVVPEEYVAEAVVEKLGDVQGNRILLPRADIARRALADDLRARGAMVEDLPVYRTRAAGDARPDLEGVDAVTFTSSSTVKNFVEGGPVPSGAKIICIGPITASTARECGLEVSEVAGNYTEDGLVAALLAAFGQ